MATRVALASLSALLIFLAKWTPATADGPDATSAYEKRSVKDFTVLVNRRVLEHKKEGAEAIEEVNARARTDRPRRLAQAAGQAAQGPHLGGVGGQSQGLDGVPPFGAMAPRERVQPGEGRRHRGPQRSPNSWSARTTTSPGV